jgi:hypothetical protein
MTTSQTISLSLRRAAARLASSRTRRLLSAAACSAAFGLSGLGCSASADIPEVQVTQTDIAFAGVPHIPGFDVPNTVTTSFDHPEGLSLPDSLNPQLHPLSGSITARGAMQDLSFLEGLTLTIASRAEGAPAPQVVASYERPNGMLPSPNIQLKTDNDANMLEYWSTKDAYYEVTLWGSLPQEDWAIDVSVSFAGEISVSTN